MSKNKKTHYFNYEVTAIIGNMGTDMYLKTSTKERIEFWVAVNKRQAGNDTKAKWFKVIVFNEQVLKYLKSNSQRFKKGTNVKVKGEIQVKLHADEKVVYKLIANHVSLNINENVKEKIKKGVDQKFQKKA